MWESYTLTLLQFSLWALLGFSGPAGSTSLHGAATPAASPSSAQEEAKRNPHGPLNVPCENCHTSAGWRPVKAVPEFDHNKTAYPLRGMHEKVKCVQCHMKPVFTNVGKNCADCHADIHRRQMGANCEQCHTVKGWDIAVQQVKDHQNRFPLLGAHAAVPCEECHKQAATGQFLGLSTECQSCHLKDWQNTTNPNHSTLGPAFAASNCQGCHAFDSWLGAKFDHTSVGFPLTAGHANVACSACHINNNYNLQIQPTDCGNSQCHLTTYQQTNNPPHNSNTAAFPISQCSNCHTTAGWVPATGFDHSKTGFLLTNGHANVPCASCHINNNYNLQIQPTDCGNSGCHLTKWQGTTTPVHSTSGPAFAAANCANCHTTKGWDSASFDHAITGWPLVGAHQLIPAAGGKVSQCTGCHVGNNYSLTAANTDCMGCHQAAWNSTPSFGGNVPNHIASNFPTSAAACSACHTITAWTDGKFDHSTTGFPLTNSHQLAPAGKVKQCTDCHTGGNYTLNIQPTDCGNAGCHATTWAQTNNPPHSAAGAPFAAANCSTCHDTIAWTDVAFNHAATGWPLVGAHQLIPAAGGKVSQCTDCHVGNNYNFTTANTDCMGCHQAAWNSTPTFGGNVPNHITSNFPTSAAACSTCHTITAWTDGKFDHSSTGWPLTGGHVVPSPPPGVQQCTDCHINGNYTLTSANTDCYGCHQATYNSTATMGGTVPNHVSAGFPTGQCSTCHNTASWKSTWSHTSTGFTLVGTHATTPCVGCHVGNNYSLTSANTDCITCHLSAWNSTPTFGGNVPDHIKSNFPQTTAACSTCHTITVWTDGKFDHSTTGWPLTGGHVVPSPPPGVQQCSDCHVNDNYTLTSANTDCYGCHQATYNSTATMGGTVPNHVSAGFPTGQCSTCHNTASWKSTWSHTSTGFTLVGTHATTPCVGCHVGNNYALTSANTSCIGCHLTAFNSTNPATGNVPNHVTSNFPQTDAACSGCHTITVWSDGKFDHSTTGWALTGGHIVPSADAGGVKQCTDCHVGGNYTLTSANTACYGCHLAAWQSTVTLGGSVPNHIASGFPTTCDTCHTTTTWLGAVFNHTYFPIPHHGSVCNDCHQVSTDYSSFTCINCHTQTAHQQTQTNNIHQGIGGYTYGPTTCYNCHKNGGGG